MILLPPTCKEFGCPCLPHRRSDDRAANRPLSMVPRLTLQRAQNHKGCNHSLYSA